MSRLLFLAMVTLHGASALPSGTLQHDTPTDVHAKMASLEAQLAEFNVKFNAQEAKFNAQEAKIALLLHPAGAKKKVTLIQSAKDQDPQDDGTDPPWDPSTDGTAGPGPGGNGTELLTMPSSSSVVSGEYSGWQMAGNAGYTAWNYIYIARQADGNIWINCKDSSGNWAPNGVSEIDIAWYGTPYLTGEAYVYSVEATNTDGIRLGTSKGWAELGASSGNSKVVAPWAVNCKWA